jgi:hypothetical protein
VNASISIAFAHRADTPQENDAPLTWVCCDRSRPLAGMAIVQIADDEEEEGMREEMLPLCSECFSSPNTAVIAIARIFHPDIDTTGGDSVN